MMRSVNSKRHRLRSIDTEMLRRVLSKYSRLMVFVVFLPLSPANADPPTWDESLEAILAIDDNIDQQSQQAGAWQVLAASDIGQVFTLFDALDKAGPLAANWIRPALDAAIDRLGQSGEKLSSDRLVQFIRDTRHGRHSRELALRELGALYPAEKKQLDRGLLNDPVALFRQPAIDQLLAKAEVENIAPAEKKALLMEAWQASREEDQAVAIAKQLKELGESVDPLQHFGWITRWYVAGPFEDENDKAYEVGFPPEHDDITASLFEDQAWRAKSYDHGDKTIGWKPYEITTANGELNFNKVLGSLKGCAAYAVALVDSDQDQDVELRMRQQNSFKLWLNGDLVMAQPIGNTGNSFDQYNFPIKLNKGRNVLVVKSSQIHPPMVHPFFETWHTSSRICDSTGGSVTGVSQPDLPDENTATKKSAEKSTEKSTEKS